MNNDKIFDGNYLFQMSLVNIISSNFNVNKIIE